MLSIRIAITGPMVVALTNMPPPNTGRTSRFGASHRPAQAVEPLIAPPLRRRGSRSWTFRATALSGVFQDACRNMIGGEFRFVPMVGYAGDGPSRLGVEGARERVPEAPLR